MIMSSKKILIFGPRYSGSGPIGGIIVLFEDFINSCNKNKINYKIIDTNKTSYNNKFMALFKIYISFFKNFRKFDHISIHGTANDYKTIAPIVVFISKIFGKKVSLRKFAGSFYEVFENSNFLFKSIISFTLRNTDFIFFETKFLVEKFKNFNKEIYWWPNSRNKSLFRVSKEFNKRFVFISQIKQSKGINGIISAAKRLDSSFIFDFYGPILDDNFLNEVQNLPNVNYKGILSPDEVVSTLIKYNVLILPTYHDGEGYPGIIIEAFSVGMPVISSNWNSIPELISHKKNGLLVPIKDVDSLVNSIRYFNKKRYNQFSASALSFFTELDSEKVNLNFLKKINFTNAQ